MAQTPAGPKGEVERMAEHLTRETMCRIGISGASETTCDPRTGRVTLKSTLTIKTTSAVGRGNIASKREHQPVAVTAAMMVVDVHQCLGRIDGPVTLVEPTILAPETIPLRCRAEGGEGRTTAGPWAVTTTSGAGAAAPTIAVAGTTAGTYPRAARTTLRPLMAEPLRLDEGAQPLAPRQPLA